MTNDTRLNKIIDSIRSRKAPDISDCVYLLSFAETSYEASVIRAEANDITRKKSGNAGVLLGQIGIAASKCKGGCKFCTFGEGHTAFDEFRLTDEQIREKVQSFCDKGDLYGLFLMTMHDYDPEFFLNAVKIARSVIPEETQIWANTGDTDKDSFIEMKKAGVSGVYHVCRLDEGVHTSLNPDDRLKTMQNALDAGLKLYSCCEPIGPEHTPQQLAENIFIGIEAGCSAHAAMRRVAVPGSPLAGYGQISALRLAQVTAVVTLASFTLPSMLHCGVHEPTPLAYVSGANMIFAEAGVNPRDNSAETSENRGLNIQKCRKMLAECGFDYVLTGDEKPVRNE